MAIEVPLRRAPQQSRGQRRIEAILDAAEELFAQIGYDATTTNAIAAHAHTSIGSLYQFFPNKEAVLRALVARFIEQMRAAFDTALAGVDWSRGIDIDESLDRILDPLLLLHARRFRALAVVLTLPRTGEAAGAGAPLMEEVIARLDERIAQQLPGIPPERRRLVVRMIVETVRALLPLTATRDGALRSDVVAEMKRMLRAYLASILAEFGAAGAPGSQG